MQIIEIGRFQFATLMKWIGFRVGSVFIHIPKLHNTEELRKKKQPNHSTFVSKRGTEKKEERVSGQIKSMNNDNQFD